MIKNEKMTSNNNAGNALKILFVVLGFLYLCHAQSFCQVCVDFAEYAENYIHDENLNTTQIIKDFEMMTCVYLPAPFDSYCDQFVESLGEPVIQCLVAGQNGTTCCSKLGLCAVSSKSNQMKPQTEAFIKQAPRYQNKHEKTLKRQYFGQKIF